MSIAEYMAELADLTRDLSSKSLTNLSGILDDEAEEMREGWPQVPVSRRREVVVRLVEMAEENVEMDFHAVFCHAMTDEDPVVRERAVSGLWESDDRRTIPKLTDRLNKDPDASVRAAAATVLGHFAQLAEMGQLIERDKMRVYDALMAVLRSDTESVEVRRRALESIAVFPDAAVAEWVVWGYRSDDPLLRQSALFAMGRSSDSQWLEMVREELSSDDAAMRFEAVNAARELAAEEAVPRLAEMVTDSDRQVVMAAVQALGGIGGAKAKKMLRGLAALSQDEAVREAAEESLQILQTDEADFLSLDPSRIDGQS